MKIDINEDFDSRRFRMKYLPDLHSRQCVCCRYRPGGRVGYRDSFVSLYRPMPIVQCTYSDGTSDGPVLCGWLFRLSGTVSCNAIIESDVVSSGRPQRLTYQAAEQPARDNRAGSLP